MKNMKTIMLLMMLMTAIGIQAQIPSEVIEVMRKCDEKMKNPKGLEMDMDIHMKYMVFSMNGTVKAFQKGDKSKEIMTMKVLGKEVKQVTGFDGTQEWEFKPAEGKNGKDSLIITTTNQKSKSDNDINFDMDKDYKKATMKLKGANYEITFSDPISKDSPKKTTIKINKDTYYFYEMSFKESGATVRMTVKKIKIGVDDSTFRFDPAKYPNAIVVRK